MAEVGTEFVSVEIISVIGSLLKLVTLPEDAEVSERKDDHNNRNYDRHGSGAALEGTHKAFIKDVQHHRFSSK